MTTRASDGYSYASCVCQHTGPTQAIWADAFAVVSASIPAPIAAPTRVLFSRDIDTPSAGFRTISTGEAHPRSGTIGRFLQPVPHRLWCVSNRECGVAKTFSRRLFRGDFLIGLHHSRCVSRTFLVAEDRQL